jgi:hypothetical protein
MNFMNFREKRGNIDMQHIGNTYIDVDAMEHTLSTRVSHYIFNISYNSHVYHTGV